jgi:TonB family protein
LKASRKLNKSWAYALVFFSSTATTMISQQPQATQLSIQQAIGEQAIKVVLDRFQIDANNVVLKTGKPLSSNGAWTIKNFPESCPKTNYPCVRVMYTVPDTDVSCEWTVLMMGSAAESVILDVNDDAAHYLSGKTPKAKSNQRWIKQPPPIYPFAAKERRVQGTVKMMVHIDATGHVDNVTVISGPDVLRSAAADAVKQWVSKPVVVESNAVPIQTVIEIHFERG